MDPDSLFGGRVNKSRLLIMVVERIDRNTLERLADQEHLPCSQVWRRALFCAGIGTGMDRVCPDSAIGCPSRLLLSPSHGYEGSVKGK